MARPFDTIHDILQCLSLVQSGLKDRNAPIWRKREPTHMSMTGTDRLSKVMLQDDILSHLPYYISRKS